MSWPAWAQDNSTIDPAERGAATGFQSSVVDGNQATFLLSDLGAIQEPARQPPDSQSEPSPSDQPRPSLPPATQNWLTQPITEIDVDHRDLAHSRPPDRSADLADLRNRPWHLVEHPLRIAEWCAPNIGYQPLYFEDPVLERYGYSSGRVLQPAWSSLHFLGSAAALPIRLIRIHPASCDYPLGYCRPASPRHAPGSSPCRH
jgi:hypothetical protein